jgi:hypothetical protein
MKSKFLQRCFIHPPIVPTLIVHVLSLYVQHKREICSQPPQVASDDDHYVLTICNLVFLVEAYNFEEGVI